MAVRSRGGFADLARGISRLQSIQASQTETLRKATEDPVHRTDDNAERVMRATMGLQRVELSSSDFEGGTYRITKSGHYVFTEDITFDPPKEVPLTYPRMPFRLGFFSAITVECPDVVINLNGHTLKQSEAHALHQRFFALIELADQPFLMGQGPANFGPDTPGGAVRCVVHNGICGRSSHHGIHGNDITDVVIHNMVFTDFEVAAVHLNNPVRCTLSRVHVHRTRRDVPVRATFSQSRFVAERLRALPTLDSVWRDRTGRDILADLEQALLDPTLPLFRNDRGMSDGNCYGLAFHRRGVAVGPLATSHRDDTSVTLFDVCVEDIRSAPEHIRLWSDGDGDASTYGAGGSILRGPVGDAISIDLKAPYSPTVLSEAQFYLAKFAGFGHVPETVLQWAETGTLVGDEVYALEGRDSMNHSMKGNIGIFLSGIEHVLLDRVRVEEVRNDGTTGHVGDDAYGCLWTACPDTKIRNVHVRGTGTGCVLKHSSNMSATKLEISMVQIPCQKDKDSTVEYTTCGYTTLNA